MFQSLTYRHLIESSIFRSGFSFSYRLSWAWGYGFLFSFVAQCHSLKPWIWNLTLVVPWKVESLRLLLRAVVGILFLRAFILSDPCWTQRIFRCSRLCFPSHTVLRKFSGMASSTICMRLNGVHCLSLLLLISIVIELGAWTLTIHTIVSCVSSSCHLFTLRFTSHVES